MKVMGNPHLIPQNFAGLLTVAPQMLAFIDKAKRIAQTQASVLVRGESGTGKDLVANYIHQQSYRKGERFSAINCAALTGEMMASELFGHKKGAFTGAVSERKGLLNLTHGGTLFLDEIAEMPLDIQARLLRVLQDKSYSPMGSSDTLHSDIRLISATHQSLRQLVKEKAFREDLMYRVRVIPLFIPPLVERTGDIEMLLWHFITELNDNVPTHSNKNKHVLTGIEESALHALLDYAWPGNVRELQNICQYLHALTPTETVTYDDLPPDITGLTPLDEKDDNLHNPSRHTTPPLPIYPDERQQIVSLLQQFNQRKGVVAEKMGISRATLWRKMKAFGLTGSSS
jgi:two-component system, NtrC family, response regulator AtoC